MKISDILKQNKKMLSILDEFTNAICFHAKLNQNNEKKNWEEVASKSNNPVVKCLYDEYLKKKEKYEMFLGSDYIQNLPTEASEIDENDTTIMLSDDDRFFLIKALESGGISDIKSLYEWVGRRRKGLEAENAKN